MERFLRQILVAGAKGIAEDDVNIE